MNTQLRCLSVKEQNDIEREWQASEEKKRLDQKRSILTLKIAERTGIYSRRCEDACVEKQ